VLPYSKRVPPKSFVRSRSEKPKLFRSETRKDSAVHVSLSSSSLVKQPGTGEAPTFLGGRVPTPLPTMNDSQPICVGCCVTQQGEEHQGRESLPWPRDPAAPRSVVVLIGPPPRRCQRVLSTNRRTAEACVHCGKISLFSVTYVAGDFRSHAELRQGQQKILVRERKNLGSERRKGGSGGQRCGPDPFGKLFRIWRRTRATIPRRSGMTQA